MGGLASGFASRPLPMCRLTSQMKPNSAATIVVTNRQIWSATQGGRLNLLPTLSARLCSQVIRR